MAVNAAEHAWPDQRPMLFFALAGSELLGRRVCDRGGFTLAEHEEREFDGGEHKARPLVDVRGADVYILHSLHADRNVSVNDRLIRLLFFISTCREHGASRITAIAPYLAYSRKDRQTKPHDPVTTSYVARLFEAAGVDCLATLEVHNLAAFQNAFRCRTLHLATDDLLSADIAARSGQKPLSVVSPDPGGVKRAQLAREALEAKVGRPVEFGFMEKRRSAGVVSGVHFAGDVEGRAVHIVDDMICGGGTILRAAEAVRARGAAEVHAIATHGLLTDEAAARFADQQLVDTITITDSVAPFAFPVEALGPRLRVVETAPLIARAINALRQERPDRDAAARSR
jgi:ribose-phosphate pyrophosphokinase